MEIDIASKAMEEGAQSVDPGPPDTVHTSPAAFATMQLQVASYIEDMSAELVAMARAARLDSLAYFIDMTRLESGIVRSACEERRKNAERTPRNSASD